VAVPGHRGAVVIAIGIDPGTEATGWALVSRRDGVIALGVLRAKGRLARDRAAEMAREMERVLGALAHEVLAIEWQHARVLAIEWQHARRGDPNPNAIVGLSAVAGMALGVVSRSIVRGRILLPIPREWKGSVPKPAHQRRILQEAGLSLDSPAFAGIIPSLRHNAVDALGLALWALKQ